MQIALRFYASANVQLVITHLGYDTVFIGSPLPLFQDSVLVAPLHTCTAPIIITSLIHQPVFRHTNDEQHVRL